MTDRRHLQADFEHFNSHAHVERDLEKNRRTWGFAHFNSHAHVERDYSISGVSMSFDISTHTHTWSVTLKLDPNNVTLVISTHTLTWSVTTAWLRLVGRNGYFNSHAHVERDDSRCWYGSRGSISTHTLTWSVTGLLSSAHCLLYHFNSHAHVERDVFISSIYTQPNYFNSHAHVERDSAVKSS